ncbi:MBL fold metallo-hydrolase [Paenibacillus sp. BSR1-1]|uniref:MBL fold metallo-hydrolase n=1 Tax=Paenibacillus sp. BSR1-1 TaxID=3020845 RepID=UPI0025B0B2B0|nr:MBL fold metallo-hydrolase [Paenibacillus sp. BSR1-1]MDN3015482.1 MBL fold metallo-hydrolase [Paenibacillus sp. BSR1-1]
MQEMKKIGERFWYMTPVSETDRPILGMVVGKHKNLMIDAGNSEAHVHYFLKELSKNQVSKPNMVVLTHWHWDHIFGLSALTEAVSIASRQTKGEIGKLLPLSWSDVALDERVKEGAEIEFCASAIKKEFPGHRNITITLPDVAFEGTMEIDLGDVTCILQHVGGDHAQDSVVVYIKEEKILFLGDCLYPDIFSPKRNYTVQGTLELLEKLEAFEAETYVLSHWKPISKEEFDQEVQMLRTIASYTEDFKGVKQRISEAYRNQVGRELTKDEIETVEDFVNGSQLSF